MYKILILTIICLFFISCGKQVTDSSGSVSSIQPVMDELNPSLDHYKKDQSLFCDENECPNFIGKIVFVGQNSIDHCVGTLISEDEVMTSATCVPESFRIPGIKCNRNIFAVFRDGETRESDAIDCKRIIYADNPFDRLPPPLWKSDTLIFKLARPAKVKPAKINTSGVTSQDINVWKVSYKTNKTSTISKVNCSLMKKSYLNPFFDNKYSNMLALTGCDLSASNIGAPILINNKIAATFSKEMATHMYSYLDISGVMAESLGNYYHFFNSSCMKYKQGNQSRSLNNECLKSKTYSLLDKFRAQMLKFKNIHTTSMRKVEQELERGGKYFKWDVEFIEKKSGGVFEAFIKQPKCIYKSNDWIDEFRVGRRSILTHTEQTINIPKAAFYTRLNKFLKPVSVLEYDPQNLKPYRIEFNPFGAHVNGLTSVKVTGELYGSIFTTDYLNIKTCR